MSFLISLYKLLINSNIHCLKKKTTCEMSFLISLYRTLWNLDVCSLLLPHLKDLISSKYERWESVSCSGLTDFTADGVRLDARNRVSPYYEHHHEKVFCVAIIIIINSFNQSWSIYIWISLTAMSKLVQWQLNLFCETLLQLLKATWQHHRCL